jgi:hypothetical protein
MYDLFEIIAKKVSSIALAALIVFMGLVLLSSSSSLAMSEKSPGVTNKSSSNPQLGFGKVYFFNNGQFLRFDLATGKLDSGYPQPVNAITWKGWPSSFGDIRAAVNLGNGKAYFFDNKKQVLRFDLATSQVDQGPLLVATATGYWSNWPNSGFGNVQAAANHGGGYFYIFDDNGMYIKINTPDGYVLPGYPYSTPAGWDGLFADVVAGAHVDWGKYYWVSSTGQFAFYDQPSDTVSSVQPITDVLTGWPSTWTSAYGGLVTGYPADNGGGVPMHCIFLPSTTN